MKTLCIYCCGGMGREIADMAYETGLWKRIVFVDDNVATGEVDGISVYTMQEVLESFQKNDMEFIVTAGEPASREKLYDRLEAQGLNITTITYPGFSKSRFSTIGEGAIIHRGAVATSNVHIGKGCLINKLSVIGHDVIIGEYSVISPSVSIGGNVNIGQRCYLGSGAIIRNGTTIGQDSIIGMGSVVLNNVEQDSVMVGNPARFLRKNLEKKVF